MVLGSFHGHARAVCNKRWDDLQTSVSSSGLCISTIERLVRGERKEGVVCLRQQEDWFCLGPVLFGLTLWRFRRASYNPSIKRSRIET